MSEIKDGGPAFPVVTGPYEDASGYGHWEGEGKWQFGGMMLRDYFAAKAMQAAATTPAGADGFTFEERAAWAYQQADAMIAARSQS